VPDRLVPDNIPPTAWELQRLGLGWAARYYFAIEYLITEDLGGKWRLRLVDSTRIEVAQCTEEYWEFVRALRTDPRVAHWFTKQVTITPEQQRKYMTAHWHEYLIALVDLAPAGYAACVDGSVRVCTHPDFQRRGIATSLIKHLMLKFPAALATIKPDNAASRKLFEACSFVPTLIVYERPREQEIELELHVKFARRRP